MPCLFVDEDMDELEEELKLLLNESMPDAVLPEIPTNPLGPIRELSLPGKNLPTVPQSHLNITTEQLEEELNQLTLTDSGLLFSSPVFLMSQM